MAGEERGAREAFEKGKEGFPFVGSACDWLDFGGHEAGDEGLEFAHGRVRRVGKLLGLIWLEKIRKRCRKEEEKK